MVACTWRRKCYYLIVFLVGLIFLMPSACANNAKTHSELTVYSGRSQNLMDPIFDQFTIETGIDLGIRYAGSAEIASTILEEGSNSPADIVFLQDPGSLGVLSAAGMLSPLSNGILSQVDKKFRSSSDDWVGITGRARTVIYNTKTIDPKKDLPTSILGFTDPKWDSRIGWAPNNGSFQSFVTGLRLSVGEEETRLWLKGILANNPKVYPKNTPIVQAAANGEIDVGFVNHYYLHRFLAEHGESFQARNHYIGNGDAGALILVSGTGILNSSKQREAAEKLVAYLLEPSAQEYFTQEIMEYPLAVGAEVNPALLTLEELNPPDINLGNLSDLPTTLSLLRDTGILP